MLTQMKINEFLELLATDAPAPGGGTASAIAGALGISLTGMVASLTLGREKYKEHETLMNEIIAEAKRLQVELLTCAEQDTEVYNAVSKAYKMPKATADDKAARSRAIQNSLKEAAKVPFKMMELSLEALILTERAVGKSNTNAASDIGVAAINIKSCLMGAWLNVLTNLSLIKDVDFCQDYKSRGGEIYEKAASLSDVVYNTIIRSF